MATNGESNGEERRPPVWKEGPESRDPKTGHFVAGNPNAGRGRYPGETYRDFNSIVRRKAKELGIDVDKMVLSVAVGLVRRAQAGDVPAAKLFLDRMCGRQEIDPSVQVNQVIAGAIAAGPPIPTTKNLGEALVEVARVGKEILDADFETLDEPPEIAALLL